MFGRREEDYERYNERQNAKYDDDYIKDSEEYREECTHSHEQTYRNYDRREEYREYREECDHSHGQTYDDFNSELKPYDEQNELEKLFEPQLEEGEYLLWCGEPQKNANSSETGTGCMGSSSWLLYMIAFAFLMLNPIIAVVLIIAASFMRRTSNLKGQKYAITNRRVIIVGGSKPCNVPLSMIGAVTFHSSARRIGYVSFQIRPEYSRQNPRRTFMASNAFFAVKDPETVAGILKQAKENYRS